MVTAVNTWSILLLRVSMRMFPFWINLWAQSHTGCSLPSHADFQDNIALWRQTWARPSLFSPLRAWKSGKRPSFLTRGTELDGRRWRRSDELSCPFSEEANIFAIVVIATATNLFFPSQWFKTIVQRQTQLCGNVMLLFPFLSEAAAKKTKLFSHYNLNFSHGLQRETHSTFTKNCLY